jgi:uncharacterized protein YecT (DUF1311 family)
MSIIVRSAVCFIVLSIGAGFAHAQEKATAEDRTTIAKCLDKAKKGKAEGEICIGVVEQPCLDKPEGQSTIGMKDCSNREALVWDERLNEAYKKLQKGGLGQSEAQRDGKKVTGADIFRDVQRAWITFRDKKCDAAGLPMEGGTGAGILIESCFMRETARQALWLEEMAREGE